MTSLTDAVRPVAPAVPRAIPGPAAPSTAAPLSPVALAAALLAPLLALIWPGLDAVALAPALVIVGFGQGWVMPSLIRIVLSEVPPDAAGAGSGVLTPAQQLSLAVGVTALGSLFVTLAQPGSLGTLAAFLIILGLQALVAVAIVVGSRALPAGS